MSNANVMNFHSELVNIVMVFCLKVALIMDGRNLDGTTTGAFAIYLDGLGSSPRGQEDVRVATIRADKRGGV